MLDFWAFEGRRKKGKYLAQESGIYGDILPLASHKGFQWFLVLNGYSKVQSSLRFQRDSDAPITFCCLYFCGRQMLAKASRQKYLFFLVNTGYFNLIVRKVPKLPPSYTMDFPNFPSIPYYLL